MPQTELQRLRDRYESSEDLQTVYSAWDAQGAETKSTLLDLLPDGWSFEGKRVLDFGCGMGRTLRHLLGEAETGEFWGADPDGAYIDELQATLSPPRSCLEISGRSAARVGPRIV